MLIFKKTFAKGNLLDNKIGCYYDDFNGATLYFATLALNGDSSREAFLYFRI